MIVQVGHYPPPIGGISVYIKRFKEFLDSENIPNKVWDVSRIQKNDENVITLPGRFFSIPAYLVKERGVDIVHYNITGKFSKIYLAVFNRIFSSAKKVISIHGDASGLFCKHKSLMVNALNTFNAIICVKENDRSLMLKEGVVTSVYEIPAFIPPSAKNDSDDALIPEKIWDFVKLHSPILLANANKIVFKNNIDLYGLDMCVELCCRVKAQYGNIGFVFCIPNYKNNMYVDKLTDEIKKKKIDENFLLVKQRLPLYPLIQNCDIFLRPTTTDGDALSVREALFYKVPTIASDSVERPKGCILFRNRDGEDLYFKTIDVLRRKQEFIQLLAAVNIENNAIKIVKVYNSLNRKYKLH